MRVLPIVAMLGCGSPMHAVDAPAADTAIPDAPVDAAAPVNRWTFNGKTYTSPTATCELPTGSPYWFVHSIAVETSGHELAVYFLYPHPPAAGTYGCIGNPNSLVTGQAVIAAGDAPNGVYYATGGQLVATVSGATVTATFANVPTESSPRWEGNHQRGRPGLGSSRIPARRHPGPRRPSIELEQVGERDLRAGLRPGERRAASGEPGRHRVAATRRCAARAS